MTDEAGSPTRVPQALGRLRVALNETFAQASHELDLTPQQAELLCVALRPRAIGDAARMLRCDRSNVSRMVDRAASRGLVKRRGGERDGRVSIIELTPAGRRLAMRFIAKLESLTAPLLAGWHEEQHRLAVDLLNTLSTTLERSSIDDAQQEPEPEDELLILGRRR